MNGSTHQMEYSSTSQISVINSALADGNLTSGRTWQEKVLLMGNFTIDAPILVTNYTELEIDGTILKGANINMIENYDLTMTQYVYVHGGILDGQRSLYSGHGIFWQHTVSNTFNYITFENIRTKEISGDAFHFETTTGAFGCLTVTNCRTSGYTGGWGLYLYRVSDSHISNCMPLGGGLYVQGGGNVECSLLYINGPSWINGHKQFRLDNFFMDISDDQHAIRCSMRFSSITNGQIRCIGDGSTSYSAIFMNGTAGYCGNNTISQITAGRLGADPLGSRRWNFTVEEINSDQDHNIYSCLNGVDTVSGALRVLGANSTYCNSTIIGDIVTS